TLPAFALWPLGRNAPRAKRAVVLALALVAFAARATAADDGALYRATVQVTGQEAPERTEGIAQALTIVLVKVSGDPGLATLPPNANLGAREGCHDRRH